MSRKAISFSNGVLLAGFFCYSILLSQNLAALPDYKRDPSSETIILREREDSSVNQEKEDERLPPEFVPPSPTERRPAIRVPSNPLPRVTIPRNTLPKNRVPANILPRNPVPRESIPRNLVPSKKIPRVITPSNKIPRNRIPSNRIPRTRIPSD